MLYDYVEIIGVSWKTIEKSPSVNMNIIVFEEVDSSLRTC